MRRFGRSLTRGKRNPACAAALLIFSFILLWGCQEPRFEVGDEVGVPPLPPSDAVVGSFDKVTKSDLTGDTYQLKDLPSGSGQPVGIFFDGKYRLFFHYFDASTGLPSVKMGTLRPASPYISTGDDGIAATSAVGGDIQGTDKAVGRKPSGDYNYMTNTGIPPGRGEPNRPGIRPGSDGKIQTQCIFDDNTRHPTFKERYSNEWDEAVPVSLKDGIYSGVDGVMQSGLGGDDVQLIYASETFNPDDPDLMKTPAGSVVIVRPNEPGAALETIPGGGYDVQEVAPGNTTAGTSTVVVSAGADGVLQTCPLGDDYAVLSTQTIHAGKNKRADSIVADDRIATVDINGVPTSVIIDGGNGIAESGIGRDDVQRIPVGQGEPHTVAIIAARDPNTGVERVLNTAVAAGKSCGDIIAGDDKVICPGKGDLAGNQPFNPDDKNTVVDPDGNGLVENYANVDDGEYFSWENTNITLPAVGGVVPMPPVPGGAVPSLGLNVPFNIQTYMPGYRFPDPAPLPGFTPNYYTFDIKKGGPDGLVAFVSNGYEIYRLTSSDGTNWMLNPGTPVLSPGNNGRPSDPVVLSGHNGICETAAEGDDRQNIAVGKGKPNTIAIFAGKDGVLQSQAGGDDKVDGMFIRTGPDGIRDSLLAGDDWAIIPYGQGRPDTACVLAGDNGVRDTTDASLTNDDRAPFLDVDSDSTASPSSIRAEAGEPEVSENGSGGFDAFAVTHPSIFKQGDVWYMFYTGWGALSELEPKRPTRVALEQFGPCRRPGLDRMMDNGNLSSDLNKDNTPGVVVAPRIGIAVSTDAGKTWNKAPAPILGIGNTCADALDISLLGGLLGEGIAGMLPPFLVSEMAFDYSGAYGARVRSDIAADGEPIYSMVYGGLHFAMNYPSPETLAAITAMTPLATTGLEPYVGLNKTGLGIARSFSLTDGWTKLKDNNPIFSSGMFYSPVGETPPSVSKYGDGYEGYFGEISSGVVDASGDESAFIGYSQRYGTVYSLCMTGEGASAPERAVAGLLLLLLPAIILLARKAFVKVRNRG